MTHPFWLLPRPLILASGSVTRRSLLESAALPAMAVPAAIDERSIEARLVAVGETASGVALGLARAKAIDVSGRNPGALVLGGDQTLSVDGEALHKPADRDAARAQIRHLAGRTHELNSAFSLVRDGVVVFEDVTQARLTMRPLSDAFIEAYLDAAGSSVSDSVGGYKLEGLGIHLFERIDGDHSTILGLPLTPLLDGLRQIGAVLG